MASLGSLTLDLVAKTGNLIEGLGKSERSLKRFADNTKKNLKTAATAFTALAAGAVASTLAIANSYRNAVDETAKQAKQVEATFASFQSLTQAAKDSGVSMSVLMSASRFLNRELGKASAGSEAAALSFRKIGLEASELSKLPLDERIGKINDALDKNVRASERASVAAEIFGSRNGQAISEVNSDVILEASRKLDIFGLRLSEVDSSKIEIANTAFSDLKLLLDGVGTQLAVHLSPILHATGNLFLQTAEKAGGIGRAVEIGVGKSVAFFGELINAGDTVKRSFASVFDFFVFAFSKTSEKIAQTVTFTLKALNYIPRLDFSKQIQSLQNFTNTSKALAKEAISDISNQWNKPLAGDKFLDFYKGAQKELENLAKADVKARTSLGATNSVFEQTAKHAKDVKDKVEEMILALQDEVLTLGFSKRELEIYNATMRGATNSQLEQIDALYDLIESHESAEKALADYKSLVQSLRTDEEKRLQTLKEQFDVIKKSGVAQKEANEMMERASRAILDTNKPSFSGSDTAGGQLFKFQKEEEELKKWYDEQITMYASFRMEFAEQGKIWDEKELEAKKHFDNQMRAIDKARAEVLLGSSSEMFGAAAEMAKVFLGENTKTYKTLFALEKSMAIARSMIAIQEGIALAAANPFPANLAAMASVASATAGIISNISAIGMAHDGMDEVPKTGTWILEKGERVVTQKTSAKLDKTLDEVKGGSQKITVNINEDASKAGKTEKSTLNESTVIDVFVSNILSDGKTARAIERKYNLNTVGR